MKSRSCLFFLVLILIGLTVNVGYAKSDEDSTKNQTFLAPKQGKQRLAYCYAPDSGCGSKAADAWCKTKGFKGAKKWKVEHQAAKGKIKTGRYFGSDASCKTRDCDLFESIICRMGPPTFF